MADELAPLSDFARGVLGMIANKPMPRQEVNNAVAWRLMQGGLVEEKSDRSPYKKHSAKVRIVFFHITEAGKVELAKGDI